MKTGSPGFIGERLTELREARGLSITALSEILGLSRQMLHGYEKNTHTPRPQTLADLSLKLNVPEAFFFRPITTRSSQNIFYRSRSAATKSERVRGERHLNWLGQIVNILRDYLELAEPNIPKYDLPTDPLALSESDIENYAVQCRRHWGLGDLPISDVALLLENNGIIVTRSMLEAPTLDAFSCTPDNDIPLIFLTSDKSSAVRSRFDAAHELGHLVLHGQVSRDEFFHPNKHKQYERQADRFGAAFLMPAETFAGDLTVISLPALKALKPKWKVSIGAMLKRCQDLELIDDDYASKLWIAFTRMGYRKREPLDDQIPPEEPRLLRRCIAMLLDSGTLSKFDLLSSIALSAKDVEALCCLPTGFFRENGTIHQFPELKLRATRTSERRGAESNANQALSETDNVVHLPIADKTSKDWN